MKKITILASGVALAMTLTNLTPAKAQFEFGSVLAGMSNQLSTAFSNATKAASQFVATHPGLVKGATNLAAKGTKMAVHAGATAVKGKMHQAVTNAKIAVNNKIHQTVPLMPKQTIPLQSKPKSITAQQPTTPQQ
jgi:hypothetical protein